mmetsp:Transcript_16408/g.23911  ORF Transcript_16408/g.23911 Transcript_16408/m.23911 type:complete len:92 (-) Transcript_16408:196-471(-)
MMLSLNCDRLELTTEFFSYSTLETSSSPIQPYISFNIAGHVRTINPFFLHDGDHDDGGYFRFLPKERSPIHLERGPLGLEPFFPIVLYQFP